MNGIAVGLGVSLVTMLVAGISEGVGTQAVVLFVNSVSRRNFWLNLLLTGLTKVLAGILWALVIWLVAIGLRARPVAFTDVVAIVAAGYLPYWLGFLVLIPFFGLTIHRLLNAASFILVLLGVAATYREDIPAALILTAGGWVVVQVVRRPLSEPIAFVNRWLWETSTGRETRFDLDDLPAILGRRRPPAPPPG